MSDKLKIFIVLVIVLAAAAVFGGFYLADKIKNGPAASQPPAATQKPTVLSDATEAEKVAVRGKTEAEVRADFAEEKEACLGMFTETKPAEMLEADRLQAISFISCQAVKKDDIKECDLLKGDEDAFKNCQEMAETYLNFAYSVFRQKDCSLSSFSDDQKNMCGGLISGDAGVCEQLASPEKTICSAVAQDKISVCDQTQNDNEKDSCRDFYYFAKAAKENNLSYLDSVKSGTGLAIYKLFFDGSLSCSDLLAPSNEAYCSIVFSDELLQRRLSIREELSKNILNK